MLVGDTQRLWVYANQCFTEPQPISTDVRAAYDFRVAAGFDSRVIAEA